ncbi:hypothetical protein C817_01393 [Dorea sp. 5-2]|nr:hypothetical protein C817_01393 [Dorea sp. 5-2]
MERKNRAVTGNYLNSTDALTAYTEVYKSPYFVDKSEVLNEIIPEPLKNTSVSQDRGVYESFQ